MEERGIIRRLDALGRIVIPREFRKLNRIEVGDPLEMRALADGDIIISKVDLSAQLKSAGTLALEALDRHTDKLIGVCSGDSWLMFSGKCSLGDFDLPSQLMSALDGRRSSVVEYDGCGTRYAAVYPIFGDTGVFGGLVLFTDAVPTEAENALMETVASLTGKSLQTF